MANLSNQQAVSSTQSLLGGLFGQNVNLHSRQIQEEVTPPWESWQLDAEFLYALSDWERENPETSLDRVLENIRNGLENSKDLFTLIPENPFPARGLVTALSHLFLLGIKISRAKKDVYDFATGVVRWVEQARSAFATPGNGYFTWQTWKNLSDMRDVVNDICLWAVKRLKDGRWSRITHGLVIDKEIREFNERVAHARALFQDLSLIHQAKGLDIIIQNFLFLFYQQAVILIEIREIRDTQVKQFDRILNELDMQKEVDERERFFARTLNVHTVSNSTYDQLGKRPCDDGTRTEVLEDIREWVNDISPGSKNFLWLTGAPGCGKSSVTASLARECKDSGVLWAQYFISLTNTATTDPKTYFPSIARQLADYSSDVAKAIQDKLDKQRSLMDDISVEQAKSLFIDSIREASRLSPGRPVVVIVDGLDETNRDRLRETAKIFSKIFTSLEACSNVKIFVSSRTENEIRESFADSSNDKHVKHVHLDTTDSTSIRDVSGYIDRNLLNIVNDYDLNWEAWPGGERLNALKKRASGLFIWAVTAVKFIHGRIQLNGSEGLNDVLEMLTAEALQDINTLYTRILKFTFGEHPSDWELERFRRIVGAILFLKKPLPLDDISLLLDLREKPNSDPVDIIHIVGLFRTILVSGTNKINGETIPLAHKSVYEFLTSDHVDAKYRVEPSRTHLELGMQCIANLGAVQGWLPRDELPRSIRYAFDFWSSHLSEAKVLGPGITCIDYRHSLSPLPPLSSKSIPLLQTPLQIRVTSRERRIVTYLGDYEKRWDGNQPVNSIVFSPNGKQIVFCPLEETVIKSCEILYSSWTRILVKGSTLFKAVAFASDNKTIVSLSGGSLLQLWDSSTGAPVGKAFQGSEGYVNAQCVAISPAGDRVLCGAGNDCILWNATNGQRIGGSWTGHKHWVKLVAFSGSGRRVCSIDQEGHCFLWDVSTRAQIESWKYGEGPMCMSFSPLEDDVIAVGGWDGIQIRTKDQTWRIHKSRRLLCLCFAPDGRRILYSDGGSVYIAEINKDQDGVLEKPTSTSGSSWLWGFLGPGLSKSALSPNLDYFASTEHGFRVHALHHRETSVDKVSINGLMLPTQPYDGDEMLIQVLSDMKAVQLRTNTAIDNRRLDAIRWYEKSADATALESLGKVVTVMNNSIVAAHEDGSVTVWSYHDSEESA